MPIPIILLVAAGVVAGAGAIGTAVAQHKLRKPLDLLVLGQRSVGKSQLINSWRGDWSPTQPTQAPAKITPVQIPTGETFLSFEKKFVFREFSDFSGHEDALHSYREDVRRADAILYLIDARTLLHEERRASNEAQSDEWVRVQWDAVRLDEDAAAASRLVFVITHTDLDPRCAATPAQAYCDHLAEQLAAPRSAINSPERVRVVAGSLANAENAEALTDDIIRSLL